MSWILHRHGDAAALASAVATRLEALCREGLATHGRATLALAGGRTPWPAYQRLARAGWDWPRLELLPTDERCVPHAHPACNLRGLAEIFAAAAGPAGLGGDEVDISGGPRLHALTVASGDPDASLAHARAMLAARPRPFDGVLLGMGGDGHFASLFPGAAQLADGFDSALDACRIDPDPLPPEAPWPRISLTLPRLLRSRALLLAVSGDAKLALLEQAMSAPDPRRRPVSALLHADAAVHIHWSP